MDIFPDAQMVEVPKDFFFEGMVLPVHVYLKMAPQTYLLIGKKNDRANFSTLHAFTNPAVGFYVQTIEQPNLMAHMTQLTSKIISQPSIPEGTKVKFLTSLAEDAMETLVKSNFTTISKVEKITGMVQQLTKSLSAFEDLLLILADLPPGESKHAMTTCLVSSLISEEMGMTQQAVQEKLIMGSLLHDVGLRYVPKAILDKPRHLWRPEELAVYEQHPIKGADMLREIRDIPQDVLLIIAEHHETAVATGFPKKVRDVKISPLARIVSLANCFSSLLFGSLAQSRSYTPDEAVSYIEDVLGQPYNKQVFLGLKNIVNKKHLADKV